jgi:hypothetical protein
MRIDPVKFRRLPLRCHSLLSDVPLHDAWAVELDGGGPGRTVQDARKILRGEGRTSNAAVRALFALRWKLGRVLGWDHPRHDSPESSFLNRLTAEDRAKSRVPPGTSEGAFRTLYVFDHESLSEVRNATVHGFLALALLPRDGGYTLYLGIYVNPVSRLTPLYMVIIDPFRRLIVYPSMTRKAKLRWKEAVRP